MIASLTIGMQQQEIQYVLVYNFDVVTDAMVLLMPNSNGGFTYMCFLKEEGYNMWHASVDELKNLATDFKETVSLLLSQRFAGHHFSF
jgi:hypothetical protein